MERREKTEFLLEQMRLLILVAREKDAEKGIEGKSDAIGGGDADWVKVRVAGRKVNETFLTQEGNEVRHVLLNSRPPTKSPIRRFRRSSS